MLNTLQNAILVIKSEKRMLYDQKLKMLTLQKQNLKQAATVNTHCFYSLCAVKMHTDYYILLACS